MTYEEKNAWLNRYREAERLYKRYLYQLAEAQTATRNITQNLSAVPGGGGDGQNLARAVEREEEAERKAYAQRAACDKLFAEIDLVLRQLDDNRNYSILRRYYLDLQTWERIADETNYSVRRIYAIRKSCVERLNI